MEAFRKMDTKMKIINAGSFAVLFAAFVFLVVLIFWEVYPYNVLTINKRPLEVVNREVKIGEILQYRLDYCKNKDYRVTIKRKFQDGLLYALPDIETTNPVGCRVQTIGLEIPHSLPPGEYIMLTEYVYRVNPVRDVVYRTHTEKFTVLP